MTRLTTVRRFARGDITEVWSPGHSPCPQAAVGECSWSRRAHGCNRRGSTMEVTFSLKGTIASAEGWWMPVPMARIETPVGTPPRNVRTGSRGTVHRDNGGGSAEHSGEETRAAQDPDDS